MGTLRLGQWVATATTTDSSHSLRLRRLVGWQLDGWLVAAACQQADCKARSTRGKGHERTLGGETGSGALAPGHYNSACGRNGTIGFSTMPSTRNCSNARKRCQMGGML